VQDIKNITGRSGRMNLREQYEKETGKKVEEACQEYNCLCNEEYIDWLETALAEKGKHGINGRLLMVGTMEIDGEQMTGCFVECSTKELQEHPVSMIYKNCTIKPQPPEESVKI
jgi:hypothetical protein